MAWEGARGLGGHGSGGVTGDRGQGGLEGHGGGGGPGIDGDMELGGDTVAWRARGHGGGWRHGGGRGCLEVGAGRGTRGGKEPGGVQGLGESGGWEGARGAPGIPSAGSRHSLVLRMSRCDTSSDSARGRYFSTLRGAELSGAARTASFPPRSPSHRPPRTTAGSSRTAPPWHRARPRESGGSAGTARRGRGLGKKGAGPGKSGRGARERGGAPPVAGERKCGRAELGGARGRVRCGGRRSKASCRGWCRTALPLRCSVPALFPRSQRTAEWHRGGRGPFLPLQEPGGL